MAEVTMSLEEFLALTGQGASSTKSTAAKPKKSRSRTGKKDPKMAKALRKANAMMRTKSGKLRKGRTQADVMRKAHQLRRKM